MIGLGFVTIWITAIVLSVGITAVWPTIERLPRDPLLPATSADLLRMALAGSTLFGPGMLAFLIARRIRLWRQVRAFRASVSSTACCPWCAEVLNHSDRSFLRDDADGVHYRCVTCGTTSRWDFDAPAPLLIDAAIPSTEP